MNLTINLKRQSANIQFSKAEEAISAKKYKGIVMEHKSIQIVYDMPLIPHHPPPPNTNPISLAENKDGGKETKTMARATTEGVNINRDTTTEKQKIGFSGNKVYIYIYILLLLLLDTGRRDNTSEA